MFHFDQQPRPRYCNRISANRYWLEKLAELVIVVTIGH